MAYRWFGLTLMVTHACNLRCAYCYAGEKRAARMSREVGDTATRRAVASLEPDGHLDVGFFGGEPLLEAAEVLRWIEVARNEAGPRRQVSFHLTTNGTVDTTVAREVLERPDMRVAVSCDGLPEVHDRFRRRAGGEGSSTAVRSTIERLVALGKEFSVVMVVRPESVSRLAEGIRWLRQLGVRCIEPSLDLWTRWAPVDVETLRKAIGECAEVWAEGLPRYALSWFDEKTVELSGMADPQCVRCGFGDGELAVTPAGRLYPCERLIAGDEDGNPMCLKGHVLDGGRDFCSVERAAAREHPACSECTMIRVCNTFCRCGNFVRTGDVRKPDGLLCTWNQACLEEVEKRVRSGHSLKVLS